MRRISRRRFMKKSIAVGTALTAFPIVLVPEAKAAWARGTPVHPYVDNLRVVGVTDPRMTTAIEPSCSWTRQNELVASDVVWENMDRLACALTKTRHSRDAWEAIFIKPPGKSWFDAVVAIKTNNIARQHTRKAVIAKLVHELTNTFGVKPLNIHIYDACHGRNMSAYTPFEGCRVEDDWGGITTRTAVPAPWKETGGRSQCLRHLVDGSVDILINVAVCKGHSPRFGKFTMTMKNHFGTFSPRPGHQDGGQDYLIAINQTPEILGSLDKRSGEVVFPRQQLCLVDALWASRGGPGGNPSHQPNFIAMGVMSPVVDYQVATKFRGQRMGWQPHMGATHRMLTDFGYDQNDLPAGGGIIEV